MAANEPKVRVLCAMVSLFSVPKPVKRMFDTFPLQTYAAQADKDEAVASKVQRRSYAFAKRGDGDFKLTAEDTYKLGVYNVFAEATTGAILATDPVSYTHLDVYKRQTLHCSTCMSNNEGKRNLSSTCYFV